MLTLGRTFDGVCVRCGVYVRSWACCVRKCVCVEGGGISHGVWEALGVGGHGDISMIIMLITILLEWNKGSLSLSLSHFLSVSSSIPSPPSLHTSKFSDCPLTTEIKSSSSQCRAPASPRHVRQKTNPIADNRLPECQTWCDRSHFRLAELNLLYSRLHKVLKWLVFRRAVYREQMLSFEWNSNVSDSFQTHWRYKANTRPEKVLYLNQCLCCKFALLKWLNCRPR